jgi:hypothetical protein
VKSQYTILADCELSSRTFNALTHAGYRTIGEVAVMSDADLLSIPAFGRRCLNEIRDIQDEYLGTDELDILTVLKGYQKRANRGGVYILNDHLEMAVVEIEYWRGQQHE